MITSRMAAPMLYRMIIVCAMIGAIHALSNTYWSKRSREISQGQEVLTELEGHSINPIKRKKTKDVLEKKREYQPFPFSATAHRKESKKETIIVGKSGEISQGPEVSTEIEGNSIHPFERKKTKDFTDIIGNILFSFFIFLQFFKEKNERENKLLLENPNQKILQLFGIFYSLKHEEKYRLRTTAASIFASL